MKTPILLLLIALLLFSCGPQAKLRRAEKLIKKAESLGAQWSVDTIFTEIPVFINSVTLDTLLVAQHSDTITLTRDRLTVRFVDLPGDTVWLSGECDSLTIIKEVPVRIEKVIYAPDKGLKWWQLILIGAGAMLVLFFIIRK